MCTKWSRYCCFDINYDSKKQKSIKNRHNQPKLKK